MSNGRRPPNPQGVPKSWGKKPPAPPVRAGGRSVCDRTGALAVALTVLAWMLDAGGKHRQKGCAVTALALLAIPVGMLAALGVMVAEVVR